MNVLLNFDFKKIIYTIYLAFYKFLMKMCYNGTKVSDIEALCIFLKRHGYPCRYLDLVHRFTKPVRQLCIINNFVLEFLYKRQGHLFTTMNQRCLSPNNLQIFVDAIHNKGTPLENCYGFVDETLRLLCTLAETKESCSTTTGFML